MKKIIGVCVAAVLAATVLSGCSDEVNSITSSSSSVKVNINYDRYSVSDNVLSNENSSKYNELEKTFASTGETPEGDAFYTTKLKAITGTKNYSLIKYLSKIDMNGGFTPYNYITVVGDEASFEAGHLNYVQDDMPMNVILSANVYTNGVVYYYSTTTDEWEKTDKNYSSFNLDVYENGEVVSRDTVASDDLTLIAEEISYGDGHSKYLFFDTEGNLVGEGAKDDEGYTLSSICVLSGEPEDRITTLKNDALGASD